MIIETVVSLAMLLSATIKTVHVANDIFNSSTSSEIGKITCELPNRIGKQPEDVCAIVNMLKKRANPSGNKTPKKSLRYIFHGKPGTGKTTAASIIAEATGCAFKHINCTLLVDKYVAQGSHNIEKIFNDALDQVQKEGRPIVLFFDEIDKIANFSNSEQLKEYGDATTTLWTCLDSVENNPLINFIGATNNVRTLHPTFQSRIDNNFVEFALPERDSRRALIKFLAESNDCKFKENDIILLTYKSEGLRQRDIKNIIENSVEKYEALAKTLTANELCGLFEKKIKNIQDTEAAINPSSTWKGTIKEAGKNILWCAGPAVINWLLNGKVPTPPSPST